MRAREQAGLERQRNEMYHMYEIFYALHTKGVEPDVHKANVSLAQSVNRAITSYLMKLRYAP